MKTVVTRIAPSPTGMMHIGTARTALFNHLYAKHTGGKFLLRVEDTDRERSTDEAVKVILDGLDWLGLKIDGEPVFQAAQANRHREVADALLAAGRAYKCYMSPEDAAAQKAANPGKAFRSVYRNKTEYHQTNVMARASATMAELSGPFVVRFKGPTEGETVIHDLVRGDVRFSNETFDDLVLLRSDGSPTYNLAVVVDDHDMGITHVIRGDDHLNNAGRQKLIYEAMGWDVPEFAHLPLIFNPEGKKLSKRDGNAASVMDYAEAGYLPETMRNYLARLGWGHGDSEMFSDAEAIEWFDVADVVSAPARMDPKKLLHMNHHYIGLADNTRLAELVGPELGIGGARLALVIGLLKDGAHTIPELVDLCSFVFKRTEGDEKAAAVLAKDESRDALTRFLPSLDFRPLGDAEVAEEVHAVIKEWSVENDVPMKVIGPALRAALTGRTTAPDLGTCLVTIGLHESIARIKSALEIA